MVRPNSIRLWATARPAPHTQCGLNFFTSTADTSAQAAGGTFQAPNVQPEQVEQGQAGLSGDLQAHRRAVRREKRGTNTLGVTDGA